LDQTLIGAIGAALTLTSLRLGRWWEIKLPDLAILAFFLFVAADACCLKLDGWEHLRAAVLPLTLAALALGSSLLARPFTLQYARQMVDSDWWSDRHFLRVNYIITAAWGISFLGAAGLNALTATGRFPERLLSAVLGVALLVAAMCFTRAYPRWYRLHRYLPRVRAGLEPYRRAPRW
jgi:hypothetical protein